MEPTRRRHAALSLALACSLAFIGLLLLPNPSEAQERAWIRGEVRLNVRTGPGTQYRILNGLATGDGVQVLERTESWTKVRLEDGQEGWIPVGFLSTERPPSLRLVEVEAELVDLKEQLQEVSATGEELRLENEELSGDDDAQKAKIDQLTLENIKLRAGARYPEMITGASILAAGMIIGAWLRGSASRRPQSRIRL